MKTETSEINKEWNVHKIHVQIIKTKNNSQHITQLHQTKDDHLTLQELVIMQFIGPLPS